MIARVGELHNTSITNLKGDKRKSNNHNKETGWYLKNTLRANVTVNRGGLITWD